MDHALEENQLRIVEILERCASCGIWQGRGIADQFLWAPGWLCISFLRVPPLFGRPGRRIVSEVDRISGTIIQQSPAAGRTDSIVWRGQLGKRRHGGLRIVRFFVMNPRAGSV